MARLRLIGMALVVAGVWLGIVTLPGVGPMLLMLAGWMMAAGAILAAAMGLGWLGFRLFAALDRLVSWSRRETDWFHPDPVDDADRSR